jgi:dissimilatory sulfite reductase (desulfoviridin) alpha/beta subunit
MTNDAMVDHFIQDRTDRVEPGIEVEGRKGVLDFDTLRTGGIIKQRQKELFTVRLMCPGGRVPLDKMERAVAVARRFGNGYIHLSNRQSLEIPYVNIADLAAVQDELRAVDQKIASCGPRVRVPTACSGCEYNPNGLTDTQAMAQKICESFFAKKPLPHKFKISFSGCPIDCMRTNEMDLGFQGAVKPEWEEDQCTGCGICAEACSEDAIRSAADGKPIFDPKKCLYCADCIRSCPSSAWQEGERGWVVRVGGKHGRHPSHGQKIAAFIPDAMVPDLVEAVIAWYDHNGRGKGRTRIGELLQDQKTWKNFLASLKPLLGRYALPDPPPPRPNEIHF